jgi:uncharacterized Zn finger protein (UPF0148 family)
MGIPLEQQQADYEALQKAKMLEKECQECTSPLPNHYGSCSQHPTNEAVKRRVSLDSPQAEPSPFPSSHTTHYTAPVAPVWFAGSEMKVTEEFIIKAVEAYTLATVEQVTFSAKGGWKVKFA